MKLLKQIFIALLLTILFVTPSFASDISNKNR